MDKRSIFDVKYVVSLVDSFTSLYPASQSMPIIFKDFMAGSVVRFKVNPPPGNKDAKPFYKRYSLAGFTAALQRSLKLCEELEEMQKDTQRNLDSDFFEENRTPETPPEPAIKTKENDSDFFI